MSIFSPSDAALEGVLLLRRHWRVAVGWGLFNLVALLAVIVVTVVVGVGIDLAAAGDGTSSAASIIGATAGGLATGLLETMLIVGLYRLMLRPEAPGFLHLRLGRDEARLFVIVLIMLAALVILAIPAVALGMALHSAVGGGQVVVGLICVSVGGWLALRFGLTAPISFAEGRIDFMGSWRLTRGHGAALFGMWFLNFVLLVIVWLALWLALFLLSGLLTGFHGIGAQEGGDALQSHPGRYLLEAIVPVVLMPAFIVLSQAPWVAAYRDLAASEAAKT